MYPVLKTSLHLKMTHKELTSELLQLLHLILQHSRPSFYFRFCGKQSLLNASPSLPNFRGHWHESPFDFLYSLYPNFPSTAGCCSHVRKHNLLSCTQSLSSEFSIICVRLSCHSIIKHVRTDYLLPLSTL